MMQQKEKLVLPSIIALIAVLGLAASITYAFPSNPPSCYALSCDSLVVSFQMTATRASNGTILFSGVITNHGRDPATGMRILVNGTDFGGDWTTTYSPGFPSPGAPLTPRGNVTFHASLGAGAPPAWPVPCQSFRCSAGDKLLIEVDLFGANTNLAYSATYITIGTG
jgi:hypothetical protein